MKTHNHVRLEIDRMHWPDLLPDETGDLHRDYIRLCRRTVFWRTLALFVTTVLIAYFVVTLIWPY